jgi:hypothetical protein
MTEHIKQAAKEQHARREEAKTLDVLGQLRAINATTLKILHHCQADPKKWGLALHAIDRVHRQIELQAKLLGDLNEHQVNVVLPAPWPEIQQVIIQALRPYPDAAQTVSAALISLDGGSGRDSLN